MSSSKVSLLPALCFLIILTTYINSTESASCCMRYAKRPLRCKQLLGYTIQNITGSCDIHAIIFHLPGRYVCADPSKGWTQRGMKCLDERRRMAEKVLEGKSMTTDLQTKA
ncbi:C-C motif chemokine 20b [Melanotaenia boesemani]|uniref:C-C motif chemokine 20b n=1 Tax=Melanotaenia boesemani TaxID=1250792 RepID=UPI001C0541CC|nr:C-C motif chemokine 20b [Melanotaenia boesemani]